jgi:anaerobic ribonucleoside-triphosphate reductase activating protein
MNYSQYYPIDVLNGLGTRNVIFVSGCAHHCEGCYNKATWSFRNGSLFTDELLDKIIVDLKDTRIKRRGLTISGGEPLHHRNISEVKRIIQRVREECPTKDIWLWTGFVLEDLTPEQREVTDMVNVLIDGKYEEENRDPALTWRGSSNQRVLDVPNGYKVIPDNSLRKHENKDLIGLRCESCSRE